MGLNIFYYRSTWCIREGVVQITLQHLVIERAQRVVGPLLSIQSDFEKVTLWVKIFPVLAFQVVVDLCRYTMIAYPRLSRCFPAFENFFSVYFGIVHLLEDITWYIWAIGICCLRIEIGLNHPRVE